MRDPCKRAAQSEARESDAETGVDEAAGRQGLASWPVACLSGCGPFDVAGRRARNVRRPLPCLGADPTAARAAPARRTGRRCIRRDQPQLPAARMRFPPDQCALTFVTLDRASLSRRAHSCCRGAVALLHCSGRRDCGKCRRGAGEPPSASSARQLKSTADRRGRRSWQQQIMAARQSTQRSRSSRRGRKAAAKKGRAVLFCLLQWAGEDGQRSGATFDLPPPVASVGWPSGSAP